MKITSSCKKFFYLPMWQAYDRLCRAYAVHFLGDKPADKWFRFLCSPKFLSIHKFWPNFLRPMRLSEKIFSRMLHDRDPILTLICDKLKVRDYVAKKAGIQYLIPLLWNGNKPEEIPFDGLPSRFVIKTNHGAGYNITVKDKTDLNREDTRRQLNRWLRENYCQDKYLGAEWGYRNIKPSIMIESFLEENGKPPVDYKFYCFDARVEVLSLHFDRFEGHKTRTYDRNFNPHVFGYDIPQWNGKIERPKNFELMVKLAESLAEGFGFIRIDLYSVKGEVFFGEFTPYPGGGLARFLPARQDYILGKKWK